MLVRAFTASAARIKLRDKDQKPRKTEEWQREAWSLYETVGEVQHAVDFRANHISKVRLYPAFVPTNPRDLPKPDDTSIGTAAIESLRSRGGTYSQLLRELSVNLDVAGEALDVDTLVATPTGFKRMGDIQPGDLVLGGDGRPCRVLVAHEILHDRPCYEVRLTGDVRIVADADHLWEVQDTLGRMKQIYREGAREDDSIQRKAVIQDDVLSRIITTEEMLETLKYCDRSSNWSIQIDSVKGETKVLPIDPYVFGYWLGDGTGVQGAITVHRDDQPYLRERVEAAGYGWSPRPGDHRGFSIGILGLQKQLRLSGLLGNKHIPIEYLRASEEQRWTLLQGLMDSDGHVGKQGTCEFANFNKRLLWDVVELTASLGLKPGRPSEHRFCFKSAGLPVVTLPRKAARITNRRGEDDWRYVKEIEQVKSRPVRCITVDSPDQTFMVTERFIRTHNCYLVGFGNAENQPEFWDIRSSEELEVTDDNFLIRDYPSGPRKEYKDNEIIVIRIYFPHPRWGALPISPLRGILASGEEVQRIERVIRSAAISRSAGPGLLLIPDEASFGNLDPTTDSQGDGEAEGDPFIKSLFNSMLTPIQEEGSASAVVPIVLRAPADVLKEIRKLSLSIDIDTELIKLDRAITRLAQGLPLPPEIVTGKEGLSHWSSFSVDEAAIDAYIKPFLDPMLSAITTEYYRPYLTESGMSEEEAVTRMLWRDTSDLMARPNHSADADYGLQHIAISDEAWRRSKGFTNDDAPSPIEKLARLLLQRGSLDPLSTVTLLKALGIVPEDTPTTNIQLPPTSRGPNAPSSDNRSTPDRTRPDSAPPSPRGPGATSSIHLVLPPTTLSADAISTQLHDLDHDLRIRLHTTAEAAVSRALERAATRIKSKLARKTRYQTIFRNISHLEAAARVGRSSVESEGIDVALLFTDSFDSISVKFRDWTARAYTRAAKLLVLTYPTPVDLISTAADQFTSDLTTYTIDRLFTINPSLEPFGEIDDTTTLPHGIVRRSLYKAGGGTELLPSTSSPPGSIATGTNILQAFLDSGGGIDGYEWVYSSNVRGRDFEPHTQLDGVRFSSFSDPILRNSGTWPPVTNHYAGDHETCFCSIKPLIVLPIQEAAS